MKQGAGPVEKFFAKKLDGAREECLWLQNPTQLPSRWNLAKIGPAKDRISWTGPRVCPREGDNRPELRLAAATKVGFDAENLQMLWPPLGQGNIKQDTSYHFTYSYFCNFSYDYSTMKKRNSWIIHKLIVYPNLKWIQRNNLGEVVDNELIAYV